MYLFPQNSQLQRKGLSPECHRRCARKCEVLPYTLLHPAMWHTCCFLRSINLLDQNNILIIWGKKSVIVFHNELCQYIVTSISIWLSLVYFTRLVWTLKEMTISKFVRFFLGRAGIHLFRNSLTCKSIHLIKFHYYPCITRVCRLSQYIAGYVSSKH